jgi:uncharacterized membrane protein
MLLNINAPADRTIRRILWGLLILDAALDLLGLALYPSVLQEGGLLGSGAAILMICFYGFLALYSPVSLSKTPSQIWRTGGVVGTIAGIWLSLDLLLNYFIYRDGPTNSKISLVVYGVYFLLLLGTAVRGGAIRKSVKAGLTAALWYVLPAQLIWFAFEFGSYYLFSQTTVGIQFIQTEMQADFIRSGARDFQTFVIGDFFGAGFFHLLLIGLLAVLLFGSIGAVVGKYIQRFNAHNSHNG